MHRNSITMRAGDWVLINSSIRHRTINTSDSPFEYFNVHFDLDDPEIRSVLGTAPYHWITGPQTDPTELNLYVDKLEKIVRKNTVGKEMVREEVPKLEEKLQVQSYILLIIHDVLSLIRRPLNKNELTVNVSQFAADVAHAIEEKLTLSLSEETSIASVAKALNLSRSHCTKMFTKVYGLSPRQYVSKQKLNMAKELLVTSNFPIGVIAEKLGFQSASHFSRQFRRWTGQSPTEFKPKQHSSL